MISKRRFSPLQRIFCMTLATVLAFLSVGNWASAAADNRIIEGKTSNHDYTAGDDYNAPLTIRKTVAELDEDPADRDFRLTLSATGYDVEYRQKQDIYAVFVIDSTSSMGAKDIPEFEEGAGNVTRKVAALEAACAYVDAFFGGAADANKHVAIVSFGNAARLHLLPEDLSQITIGHKTKESDVTKKLDYWLGVERLDSYSPKWDAKLRQINAEKYYSEFVGEFTDNTDLFFYSDPSKAKEVIRNISSYGKTNPESGLLMADFLLKNSSARSSSRNVFLFTDGEANASSSISMYEYHPKMQDVINMGYSQLGYSGSGDDYLSYKKLMEAIADKASDSAFVSSVTGTNINFFAGNHHNVDRKDKKDENEVQLYHNTLIKMLPEEVDSQFRPNLLPDATASPSLGASAAFSSTMGYATLSDYFQAIDDYVELCLEKKASLTANEKEGLDKYFDYLERYGRHLFWMSDIRDPFHPLGTTVFSQDNLAPSQKVFGEMTYSTIRPYNMPYDQLFPEGKLDATKLSDYKEHGNSTENVAGSNSAKGLMVAAADKMKAKGVNLYAVGIGSWVVFPEKLEPVASQPYSKHFITCGNEGAIVQSAERLYKEFQLLGTITSKRGIENVTITDHIKRRAGSEVADDDTFTVDKASFSKADAARLYYYKDGQVAAVNVPLTTANFSAIDGTYQSTACTTVSWNAGTLYSEDFAKEKQSVNYPFKAELVFDLAANKGVYASAKGVYDIDTNLRADVTWDDSSTPGNEMEYPVPAVYFEPEENSTTASRPTQDTTASETTGETTSEEESESTPTTTEPTPGTTATTEPTQPTTRPDTGGSSTTDPTPTQPTTPTATTAPTQATTPTGADLYPPPSSSDRPDSPNFTETYTPIGETPVPLAEIPQFTQIFDDGVPLAALPQTGGSISLMALAGMALSLCALFIGSRKED